MTESAQGAGSSARILGLVEAAHLARPMDVPALVADHADGVPGRDAVLYLTDLEQRTLIPLQAPGVAIRTQSLGIDTTVAGRAFRTNAALVVDDGSDHRVWLPLLDGTTRVGVLEVTVDDVNDAVLRRAGALASLAAELIVTKNAYGDAYHQLRRSHELTLAAEMQWSLLPPLTFSDGRLSISGALEPSYEIAGDTFDYAINGDIAHIAIFDAMGHGFEATRMASIAATAYRHRRRMGASLGDTYEAMDAVVSEVFGTERFLTAQLAELHIPSGLLRWLNAGHHPPLLVRRGKLLGPLESDPCLPVGLRGDVTQVAEYPLESGDRLLFFTDGVVEARSPAGEFFGEERLGDFLVRAVAAELPAAETSRRLSQAILAHQADQLQDDATTLYLEWFPEPGEAPGVG